jgi:hypothetical protein
VGSQDRVVVTGIIPTGANLVMATAIEQVETYGSAPAMGPHPSSSPSACLCALLIALTVLSLAGCAATQRARHG